MRPMLNPALRRVWRDPNTVQFGVDVQTPVLLTGVGDETAELLRKLDGTHDWREFVPSSSDNGDSARHVESLLNRLSALNVLIDGASWPGGRGLSVAARARLAPDLAAAALRTTPGDPARQCNRFAETAVGIVGVGRLGAVIATLLTASGVGRVDVHDDGLVESHDVCVGGFEPSDVGHKRKDISRSLSTWETMPPVTGPRTFTIITDESDTRIVSQQQASLGIPHLLVSSTEAIAKVGPLVLPGKSACLRCIDLEHSERDAGWPKVVVQPNTGAGIVARDSNLTVSTAALAAVHVLSWLSGTNPASVNGVIELHLADGATYRRSARFHPACGCAWSAESRQDTMAG
ncbi:MAG TPA: ThiF family adenylyltransferase [Actinomycetes bacterium]|nr:ThiF family adenylyltransferase [Actinomycetes bacterium]